MTNLATKIEWTDVTWSPVTGCDKVSPGCAHCYAETVALRFWPTQYRPVLNDGSGRTIDCVSTSHHEQMLADGEARPRQFTDVQTHEDRLDQPLRWRKPRRVFVNSMSDLFHEDVSDAFIERVFAVMALAPKHAFQILTKRAERMRDYMRDPGRHHAVTMAMQGPAEQGGVEDLLPANGTSYPRWPVEWPLSNVWLGVSVENQHFADERIPLLLQTPAAVRFISAEPLLGRVNLAGYITEVEPPSPPILDWVIVGGESGHGARPMEIAWARSIVAQCQAAGVPVFVKQLGADPRDAAAERDDMGARDVWPAGWMPMIAGRRVWRPDLTNGKGGDPLEWPADLRVRQFPEQVHA